MLFWHKIKKENNRENIFSTLKKIRSIGRKGHCDHCLRFPSCDPHQLSAEGRDDHGTILQRFIGPVSCSIVRETALFAIPKKKEICRK